MRVRFIPPAKRELIDASRFYERRLPGLGDAFLDEAAKCVELIKQYPGAWPNVDDTQTKRIRMRRFPFGIVYRVEREEIVVFAVAHAKQHPDYWKRRLTRSLKT